MRSAGVQFQRTRREKGSHVPRRQAGWREQTLDSAGTKGGRCVEGAAQCDTSSPETGADRVEAGRGKSWGLGAGKGCIGTPVAGSLPRTGVPCVSSEGKVQPLNAQ